MARGFGRNGAKVAVHYHSSRTEAEQVIADIKLHGGTAALFGADVRNPDEVENLVGAVSRYWGRLDVLVNNAGGLVKRAKLEEITDELYDEVLNLNVRSVVTGSRAAEMGERLGRPPVMVVGVRDPALARGILAAGNRPAVVTED